MLGRGFGSPPPLRGRVKFGPSWTIPVLSMKLPLQHHNHHTQHHFKIFVHSLTRRKYFQKLYFLKKYLGDLLIAHDQGYNCLIINLLLQELRASRIVKPGQLCPPCKDQTKRLSSSSHERQQTAREDAQTQNWNLNSPGSSQPGKGPSKWVRILWTAD